MATIGDVARAAGVSRSTVSYVLSGNRTISQSTRDRVASAITQLGFTPNAGARALATAQSMVLGLMLEFHEDEFPPAMLQYILAVTTAAREKGYDILMVTDPEGGKAVTRITASNMVDGVILLDVAHDDSRLTALKASGKPGALIGLPRDTEGVDVFDLDYGEAARLLLDHLYGLGHHHVALVSPPRHVFERGGAYAWRFRDAAMERAGRYGISLYPYYGESRQPGIGRSINALLDARPEVTAMIVHNDASVADLPAILSTRGIRVPEDLSVVSVNSRNFSRTFNIPFTTVELELDVLGREAVRHLVRRIADGGGGPGSVIRFVEPELTNRGSTASPRPF